MTEKRLDTVRLQTMVKGFWESSALMAAVEIGLFTAVDKGNTSIETAAKAVQISETNAERLMTACTALGLLVRDGGSFSNAPDVDRFLVEGKPSYAGPWMLFSKPRWGEWGKLTEHLQAEDSARLGMYTEFTEADAKRYHAATYSIGMGAARRFHKQVDLSAKKKLIDIGGGSGCYCIIGAQNHPNLEAVVLDLPQVVPVTRTFIEENGVSDRVTAEACDFTADPFPDGADVAIMASNLPQYSAEIITQVVQKTFDALESGGEFHLIGEMLDDDGSGPIAPALWGLSEALSHSTGRAHSEGECKEYFAKAGFVDVDAHEFIPQTLTRITGRKP
jgi:precorrin-6B methylase 2